MDATSLPFLICRSLSDKKKGTENKADAAFDASRLSVEGTWPSVVAKIELNLHLSRRIQLR